MKIHQVMPTIIKGDAISNEALALHELFLKNRFKGNIYAENIGNGLPGYVKSYNKIRYDIKTKDIILYHLSTGTNITKKILRMKNKKITRYHNITPKSFFQKNSEIAYKLAEKGRNELTEFDKNDLFVADSEYNKAELLDYGYNNSFVCPLVIKYSDYNKNYDKSVSQKMLDGKVNILFTGRIAPNKKQDDIIKTFYYYKKYINKDSRLILVGSYEGMESYYCTLLELIAKLELKDVIFTNHIPFSHVLAYYKTADVFLCMSEHEGFCVPLVEAMYFNIPIISYNSSAIPYTLGQSGILFSKKDYIMIAETINEVLTNFELKRSIITKQNERLKYFDNQTVEEKFMKIVMKVNNI